MKSFSWFMIAPPDPTFLIERIGVLTKDFIFNMLGHNGGPFGQFIKLDGDLIDTDSRIAW
jgi:hypothetical protein